jgi:hypothetical protein
VFTGGRSCFLGLVAILLAGSAAAAEPGMIMPDTPQAARVLARLQEADRIDHAQYQVFLGSRDNDVAMYYLSKRRHVLEAIKQLQSGEPVSEDDINRALDASEAWRYGSTF